MLLHHPQRLGAASGRECVPSNCTADSKITFEENRLRNLHTIRLHRSAVSKSRAFGLDWLELKKTTGTNRLPGPMLTEFYLTTELL